MSRLVTGFVCFLTSRSSAAPDETRRDSEKDRSDEKTSETVPDDEDGGERKTKG